MAALFAATAFGCGSTADLVYVIDVAPFDGVSGAAMTSIDTTAGVCVNDDGSVCKDERIGDHFARITVANDYEPDSDNPAFGRRIINGFELTFISLGQGPELPGTSDGVMRVVLEPGQDTVVTVILADSAVKSAVGGAAPELYQANYPLTGPDSLKLNGAVTVSIGNYNSCEPGLFASPGGSC